MTCLRNTCAFFFGWVWSPVLFRLLGVAGQRVIWRHTQPLLWECQEFEEWSAEVGVFPVLRYQAAALHDFFSPCNSVFTASRALVIVTSSVWSGNWLLRLSFWNPKVWIAKSNMYSAHRCYINHCFNLKKNMIEKLDTVLLPSKMKFESHNEAFL